MLNSDYKYNISYETMGFRDCINHGCEDEGICRCFTITGVNIKKINIPDLSNLIYLENFDIKSNQYQRDNKLNQILYNHNSDVDIYCIDRILTIHKIYNISSWESYWSSGYYGDEVDTIYITKELCYKIEEDLKTLFSLSTIKEKIEFLLIKEYKYLLNSIIDKEYQLFDVNVSDVIFGQEYHKLNIEECEYYSDKNYKLIKGICTKDGQKWRVIDGYHRILSTKMNTIKIVGIY